MSGDPACEATSQHESTPEADTLPLNRATEQGRRTGGSSASALLTVLPHDLVEKLRLLFKALTRQAPHEMQPQEERAAEGQRTVELPRDQVSCVLAGDRMGNAMSSRNAHTIKKARAVRWQTSFARDMPGATFGRDT